VLVAESILDCALRKGVLMQSFCVPSPLALSLVVKAD